MNAAIFYAMALMIAGTEAVAAAFLNSQRKKLDLSKPADVAKDKSLRLIVMIVSIQAVVIPAILLLVIKPMVLTS